MHSVTTQMTEANFKTFQHHKSQKIMTYSSIIYVLLTLKYDSKNIDIKLLPVSIIDAKTMLSFSTLRELHHEKLLHQ